MERCGGNVTGREWMVSGGLIRRGEDVLIKSEFRGEVLRGNRYWKGVKWINRRPVSILYPALFCSSSDFGRFVVCLELSGERIKEFRER